LGTRRKTKPQPICGTSPQKRCGNIGDDSVNWPLMTIFGTNNIKNNQYVKIF
jgi:hypothetical protein